MNPSPSRVFQISLCTHKCWNVYLLEKSLTVNIVVSMTPITHVYVSNWSCNVGSKTDNAFNKPLHTNIMKDVAARITHDHPESTYWVWIAIFWAMSLYYNMFTKINVFMYQTKLNLSNAIRFKGIKLCHSVQKPGADIKKTIIADFAGIVEWVGSEMLLISEILLH